MGDNSSLSWWIATQLPLLEDDDNDNNPVQPQSCEEFFPMPLDYLFNFDTDFWQERWENNYRSNLDEEMAVLEWLNLDAEGDEDEDSINNPNGEQEFN